jgi:hypothetical protein
MRGSLTKAMLHAVKIGTAGNFVARDRGLGSSAAPSSREAIDRWKTVFARVHQLNAYPSGEAGEDRCGAVVETPVFGRVREDGAMASVEVLFGPEHRQRWSNEQTALYRPIKASSKICANAGKRRVFSRKPGKNSCSMNPMIRSRG